MATKSKSPKLLCLYIGEAGKAALLERANLLGFNNASVYVRTLTDLGAALTRQQIAALEAEAKRRGVTPADLLAELVAKAV